MAEGIGQGARMKVSEGRAICYGAAGQGGPVVTRSGGIAVGRASVAGGAVAGGAVARAAVGRVALAGALATALALAGCGRKGGLDEPPLAATDQSPPPGQAVAATTSPDGRPNPPPPATQKRHTFLDWLID